MNQDCHFIKNRCLNGILKQVLLQDQLFYQNLINAKLSCIHVYNKHRIDKI